MNYTHLKAQVKEERERERDRERTTDWGEGRRQGCHKLFTARNFDITYFSDYVLYFYFILLLSFFLESSNIKKT